MRMKKAAVDDPRVRALVLAAKQTDTRVLKNHFHAEDFEVALAECAERLVKNDPTLSMSEAYAALALTEEFAWLDHGASTAPRIGSEAEEADEIDPESPFGKIVELASRLQKAAPSISDEVAITAAALMRPDLYIAMG